MIITRTPFRVSFFGGGTDYPAWYRENGGAVLSTSIDKYCYILCRSLPPFFDYKYSILYSKTEFINDINEIQHPAVREVMRFMNVNKELAIHYDGDLPARSGLGSSSAFTVGLLHALNAFSGKMISKKKLMLDAIHVEQNMIKENVGSQDQAIVAFGGFNRIGFSGNDNVEVTPLILDRNRSEEFQSHLMLFFTGITRIASDIAAKKILQIPNKSYELNRMKEMVDEAINLLVNNCDITDFGRLLHEAWKLKRGLADGVSNGRVDDIYETAMNNGAIGGKLLGAGGGGFILFFVKPQDQARLRKALGTLMHVPFRFDMLGSQVIYYSESGR